MTYLYTHRCGGPYRELHQRDARPIRSCFHGQKRLSTVTYRYVPSCFHRQKRRSGGSSRCNTLPCVSCYHIVSSLTTSCVCLAAASGPTSSRTLCHVHTYIHTHVYVHMYIYIYIHIHTHRRTTGRRGNGAGHRRGGWGRRRRRCRGNGRRYRADVAAGLGACHRLRHPRPLACVVP